VSGGTFDARGQLDTSRGIIATCVGKKRSGKSVMGLLLFRSYPYDRLVLDIAGDDGPTGPDIVELRGTVADLPTRWPELQRKEGPRGEPLPMTVRYVPDPGSPTFREDMDKVVGLVMAQGRAAGHACILVHEIGVLAPAGQTGPHTKRLLMHNRHNHVTAIFCGPRPMTVDPLVIAQSDLIYAFETPNPADRRRLAEVMGWNPQDLDDAHEDLATHEYLRFDANMAKPEEGQPDMRLVHFPALPSDVVDETKRWANGRPADPLAA
jgi:hypothetical protein